MSHDKSLSLINGNAVSMTSLEIATLVESRHDKVKQSIERLADRGAIRLPPLGISDGINNLGLPQKTKLYVFTGDQGKRDSIIVVAQLSPEFTARLVDRWQELETQLATPQYRLPQTYLEALKDLVVAHEELEITRPKAAALDLIVTPSAGSMCITDAAKHLQMRRDDLINYLYQSRWVYRRNGNKNLIGYAHILQQGLLEHKLHSGHDENGVVVHESVRVTRKGLRQLAQELAVLLPFRGEK